MSGPLPPGWRMTNRTGSHAGPVRQPEDDVEDDEVLEDEDENGIPKDQLDIRPDSPGWEDVEDDSEQLSIKSFFSDQRFPSAQEMLSHCKSTDSFDFLATCKQHDLDFYSTIRLVNYIRSQSSKGSNGVDVSSPSLWADDRFLQPVLEDDALLFCLDEVVGFGNDGQEPADFDERAEQAAAKAQRTDLDGIEE